MVLAKAWEAWPWERLGRHGLGRGFGDVVLAEALEPMGSGGVLDGDPLQCLWAGVFLPTEYISFVLDEQRHGVNSFVQ